MQLDKNLYDVIIVGGGPAGLSAAIYAARARYRVLVLEKEEIGGQITITEEIVNYPGVVRTSGRKLTEGMRRQAESFGAEFAVGEVLNMELLEDMKTLHTTRGDYRCLGVVLAPGANPRKIGFLGEKEYQGRGVAYCATCDGEFFTGMEVFVIGGGFAAVEEGIFLTKYARKVTLVVRGSDFSCAKTVSDKIKNQDKIEVLFETELLEVGGEQTVSYARLRNNRTEEEWVHKAKEGEGLGIFVFAGYVPDTEWINQEVEKNDKGYILTDENHKTNLAGVYAAGDVCVKNLRQVVTAVSDGAIAATSLEREVSILHEKLGIPDLVLDRRQSLVQHQEEKRESTGKDDSGFLNEEIHGQLSDLFAKFTEPVIIRAWLDDSPLSYDIEGFLRELEGISEKVTWKKGEGKAPEESFLPSMELLRADGTESGIAFHGVPGGHEFNSFVAALYNVAGPGQEIAAEVKETIKSISRHKNIKILVSLSCTMCPETVISAQKAASISENIQAEMFDLAYFPDLKRKYNVMSVPCMVINDSEVHFGKKGILEVAEILAS